MIRALVFLAVLSIPATILAQESVSDADLDRAMQTCRPHKNLAPNSLPGGRPWIWQPGHEHCAGIESEVEDRRIAKEKSADFARDIAKRLGR